MNRSRRRKRWGTRSNCWKTARIFSSSIWTITAARTAALRHATKRRFSQGHARFRFRPFSASGRTCPAGVTRSPRTRRPVSFAAFDSRGSARKPAGILLQFFTLAKTWEGYYAGTISPRIQRPMIRIADKPPRKWEVVTRDLFQDFGPITITGINFSAMEGPGEAYFDHIYLARTVEDLDRVTASAAKVAESMDGQVPPGRSTGVLPTAVGAFVVVIVAAAFIVLLIRRRSRSRQPAPATHVGPIPDERSASIIFAAPAAARN